MAQPNLVTKGEGYYISYNSIDTVIYGCDTTALVIGQMQAFYILNGDHRKGYNDLPVRDLESALGYFRTNEASINHRSDKLAA